MHVILIGAQGSGKGTQAASIAPRLNLEHVSTGDLFRAAIASKSPIGQEVKEIYDRGDLVPDALTISLVGERLEEIVAPEDESSCNKGALFDGFPRTLPQAEGLEDLLKARSERISVVIELAVPTDRLVTRLAGRRVCASCGATYHVEFNPPAKAGACDQCAGELLQREDDKPEPIKRRLALYFDQTAPVLSFYRERGMLVEINGDQPIDVVSDAIVTVVSARTARLASIGGRG